MINKYIIITSIHSPSLAVKKFADMPGFKTLIIGDRKTPDDWYCPDTVFLSCDRQNRYFQPFTRLLPYDHYCRKMIGYLFAMHQHADVIIDTDDDNRPSTGWQFPVLEKKFQYLADDLGFINVYRLFTKQKIWPRGLPLQQVNTAPGLNNHLTTKKARVGIWQALADKNPDVDAIYRLTNTGTCYFKKRKPIVLGRNTVSPFNAQNTLFRKELFPLLYLPAFTTFRFTDILRSWVAQPIMWAADFHLGFTSATVVQERNEHNNFNDFISELPMYQYSERIVDKIISVVSSRYQVMENLYNAYEVLVSNKFVPKKELTILRQWIRQIQKIKDGNI